MHAGPVSYHLRDETDHPPPRRTSCRELRPLLVSPAVKVPVDGLVPPPLTRLVAEFTAAKTGELFLSVNDAMPGIPFYGPVRAFYANNAGTARVTVERLPR